MEYQKEMEPYIARLHKEWQTHGKIILAVDFDDTVSPWGFKDMDFTPIFKAIKHAQTIGAYVVIFTACKPDRYQYIRDYCKDIGGFDIDGINENVIDLPFGNERKIYYNHLLDDRSALPYSLAILEIATMRRFCDHHTNQDYA